MTTTKWPVDSICSVNWDCSSGGHRWQLDATGQIHHCSECEAELSFLSQLNHLQDSEVAKIMRSKNKSPLTENDYRDALYEHLSSMPKRSYTN